MSHFTLQFGAGGPLLSAIVNVSQARHDALVAASQPIPTPVPIRALVDTGASATCIDPTVLHSLSLSPTGIGMMLTPTTGATPQPCNEYDLSLLIPGSSAAAAPLYYPTLKVMESHLIVQGFHALIGRDILKDCVLTYNGGTGLFTLAY